MLQVKIVPVTAFQQNCSILWDSDTKEAVLIDAGGDAAILKKEVEDLMNADPLEFFLKFSEGMKGMDTTDLAKTMEFLKMNDQYVISTMGAASENTEKFRASIELSNKSLTVMFAPIILFFILVF